MKKLLLSLLTIISMLALLSFTACIDYVQSTDSGSNSENSVVETTTYTVTWVNEDGTVLETDEGVEEGTVPTYDGETPTKEATAQYTYTFAGWDVTPVEVTADVTYTATFTATPVTYTVTWLDADGTELNVDTVEYEGTITALADPSKTPDANYIYTFAGWDANDDGEVDTVNTTVTANATYKAVYTTVANPHGYMRAIVATATNSTGLVFDDENGTVSTTAAANNMYIYLDGEEVLSYGEGMNYLKVTVSSSTGASFQIVTMNADSEAADGNWSAFPYDTVYGAKTYYVPLNDTSVMDFANYDLRLYVGYATQQLTIESIGFVEEIPLVASVENGTMSEDGKTFTGTAEHMYVSLSHTVITEKGAGKDYIKLTMGSPTMAEFRIVTNNGTENLGYVYTTLGGSNNVWYIPLNDKSVHDFSKYDLKLYSHYATHQLVIEGFEYITKAEIPMISSVKNGSYADGVYTATADNMFITISSLYINANAGENDYIKLTVSGPAGVSFGIYTQPTDANDPSRTTYVTVYSSKTFYIPLKDKSVHDFSKYDLKLYAGYNTQQLVIEGFEFITEAELPSNQPVSNVVRGTVNGNVYTATSANMEVYINHEYVQKYGAGKNYVKLTIKSTSLSELYIGINNGSNKNWGDYDISYVHTTLGGSTTYYFSISDKTVHDWQYDLLLMIGGAEQTLVIEGIEFVDSMPGGSDAEADNA